MTYTIGELAKEFSITFRTLRFYEEKQLIHPSRNGNKRIYSRRDRARLMLALQGKRIGLSIFEIRELLNLYNLENGPVRQLEASLSRFVEQKKVLQKEQEDLKSSLEELDGMINKAETTLMAKQTGARSVGSAPFIGNEADEADSGILVVEGTS